MPIKERYHANREKYLIWKRQSDARRKDKIRAWSKRYYKKNREAIKSKSNRWHHANKASANARTRRWHNNHPAESKANKSNAKHVRRAKEYGTRVDTYGIYLWMKRVKSSSVVVCHWCGDSMLGISTVFDHVIPISKGGSHTIGNLCVSCASCNSSKKDKMPNNWTVNSQTFFCL